MRTPTLTVAARFVIFVTAVVLAGCQAPGSDTEFLPATAAIGPYSGSVRSGDLCFVSGKIGQRGGRFEQEATTAIDAVEAELARSGLDLGDLVKVTVYLTDMNLYGPFNEIYADRLEPPYPARVCVAVRELPAGARVEIAGIARRGDQ
ncbi:MAG: Rid family hydrolase [Planctomycetota bacterium]